MSFEFKNVAVEGVKVIEPKFFGDQRGAFAEIFKDADFKEAGVDFNIKQVNFSMSEKGVLRGLHYQLNPAAQGKIMSVVKGEIFDVAVDIRKDSETYGKWVSEVLSSENHKLVYIPEGFAHGFCVMSDIAQIIYYCNSEYAPEFERTILWNDPALAIDWPLSQPVLSDKDKIALPLSEVENNF